MSDVVDRSPNGQFARQEQFDSHGQPYLSSSVRAVAVGGLIEEMPDEFYMTEDMLIDRVDHRRVRCCGECCTALCRCICHGRR